ncbi:hypothetical protein [Arsenicibacter rosenii]|uniref:Uncharacterized protein n=1 Tax=Arsenicibacter rosenii TaxID=1750698 RepID=A0A1S2VQV1_9BACT|nr:hypothetical protein [Arsenicibacter rosenii]OIN61163.1 hypothetical protein BLX24_03635 [Arsenicibacter rosenii]
MKTGTLLNYVAYFQEWADNDPELTFFMFGSVELGLEAPRSHPDFNYPFAWLEQPTIISDSTGNHNFNEVFQSGISVLFDAPQDDHDAQIRAYDSALSILYRLQSKLHKDTKDGSIICEVTGIKKEAVSQLWLDSHYGFRMEFMATFNLSTVYKR